MVLGENHKTTMKSIIGPTNTMTYTGTISCMGNPDKCPLVIGNFLGTLCTCFRHFGSYKVVRLTRKVVKPQWSVSAGSIY